MYTFENHNFKYLDFFIPFNVQTFFSNENPTNFSEFVENLYVS